ncbi:hypothetical protein [Denitromonas sp.]|uniref:hypothetical protein n=1 Tax=Denitromonas sp. TaxID=2734609 RepID=UPI003A83BF0E
MQRLLGHGHLGTTLRYVHLVRAHLTATGSPLDLLELPGHRKAVDTRKGVCKTLAPRPSAHTIPIVTAVPAVQFNKVYPPQRRRVRMLTLVGGG